MDQVFINIQTLCFTPQDEIPNPKNLVILFLSLIPDMPLCACIYIGFDKMTSIKSSNVFSLVFSSPLGLVPACFGAAIPVSCGSIYKSFAQCLLTLGDSLVDTQKDQNTQDIDAICRCVCACVCSLQW